MNNLKTFENFNEKENVENTEIVKVDESLSEILAVISEILNDQTTISIAGEMIEKGLAIKLMLAAFMGLPAFGAMATAVQNWFKKQDPKKAFVALKNAPKGASL